MGIFIKKDSTVKTVKSDSTITKGKNFVKTDKLTFTILTKADVEAGRPKDAVSYVL